MKHWHESKSGIRVVGLLIQGYIRQPDTRRSLVWIPNSDKFYWRTDGVIVWGLTLSQTSPGFYVSAVQVIWKHCGKRRNCSWRAISPFPTVFSTHLKNFLAFSSYLKLWSAISLSLKFVVWERANSQSHPWDIVPAMAETWGKKMYFKRLNITSWKA